MLLIALFLSCVPKTVPVQLPDPGGEAAAQATGRGALFLQGVDVRWHARPHRVSGLGFGASGVDVDDVLTGTLFGRIRGGTWASGVAATDVASLSVKYGAVQGSHLAVATARAELSLVGALPKRDQEGLSAQTTVTVELPLPELSPEAEVVVWLQGFDFDTRPSHDTGYTPRAIGVSLGPVERTEAGMVSVDVTARLDGAPVPDRRQALGAYASTAWVELVVVGSEHAHATRLRTGLDEDVPPLEEGALRRSPQRLPLGAELAPGTVTAIAGLTGFSLEVDSQGPMSGRYLRALTVAVEDERLDLARGSYDAAGALRFANSGPIPRKLHLAADLEVSLLQLTEPAAVRRGRWQPGPGQGAVVAYPSMEEVEGP
jgi:hypothetical protein